MRTHGKKFRAAAKNRDEASVYQPKQALEIVKKSGAWFTYEGEQLGQGRENAKTFLTENPELLVEIDERIRTQVGIGANRGEPTADDAVDLLDEPITLDD